MSLQVDYDSETDVNEDYTSRRTSKVTYRSEVALPNPLEKWSRRIETAARLGTFYYIQPFAFFELIDGAQFCFNSS